MKASMRARRHGTQKSSAASGGSGGGDGQAEILPLHAGEDEHHGGDSGEDQRGAEVGLLDDQQHEDDGHDGGAQQRVTPVAHLVETVWRNQARKRMRTGLAISDG